MEVAPQISWGAPGSYEESEWVGKLNFGSELALQMFRVNDVSLSPVLSKWFCQQTNRRSVFTAVVYTHMAAVICGVIACLCCGS